MEQSKLVIKVECRKTFLELRVHFSIERFCKKKQFIECKEHLVFTYLKMRPSLAMAYSILGKGNRAPIKEALNPQRAPTAMIYLAHSAPLIANTSGRALLSDSL